MVILKRATKAKTKAPLMQSPESYDFVIQKMNAYGNGDSPIPTSLKLILPDPVASREEQLYINYIPLPKDQWSYNPADRKLTWKNLFGGGHLFLRHDGLGATGNIGPEHAPVSVLAGAVAHFSCDVALNTGATYISSGGTIIGFQWDPNADTWKNANWVKNRLLLKYVVTQGSPVNPPSFTFEFKDQQTRSDAWIPDVGSFLPSLQTTVRQGKIVFRLEYKSNEPPPADSGINPPTGPDSVFPYWLQAVEDSGAGTIDGVMEIDNLSPAGTLVGLQGVQPSSYISGYYRTAANNAPFGIFDNHLLIGDELLETSFISGDALNWSGLSQLYQERTGLPESGQLHFLKDGSWGKNQELAINAQRLSASAAANAIKDHNTLHQKVYDHLLALNAITLDDALKISDGLLTMSPFVQNDSGSLVDVIQAAVTSDMGQIMNSFIPTDMWNLIYPELAQPSISGQLAIVANSPVKDVTDPIAFYQSLATAVMTKGMANGSDANCRNLNGPRASAWLKSQVTNSKVYYAHSQMLFQYHWQQKFPVIQRYLSDQVTNASMYAAQIDANVDLAAQEINNYVSTDAATDPNLKANMVAEARAVGAYAKSNNLYWAFIYYNYNVTSGILANIALNMSGAGSPDSSFLTQLFQQNTATLTALDPSGYFAKEYVRTINTFLSTNILTSMFGFSAEVMDFSVIKEYLKTFVENNLTNEDKDIAEAAAKIAAILADANADEMLRDSIQAISILSDTIHEALSLPFISGAFLNWFKTKYVSNKTFWDAADVFSGLFIGGVAALNVFNLFSAFKDWNKLDAGQKTQIVINATQLGLQIISAIVKRGVRITAIFGVDGLTGKQRLFAMSRIFASGESEDLNIGLGKIGNRIARWLGDTEGSLGRTTQQFLDPDTGELLFEYLDVEVEEVSWATKIFGKNLDEFLGNRLGPIFILAGIGLSLYNLIEGESAVAIAADVINIIGGALMLFGIIGGWVMEAGVAVGETLSTFISACGPLALLAAIAGLALALYEIFHKDPDPVQEFVDQYVAPAGLKVIAAASSIDYAFPYLNDANPKQLMIGFSLSVNGKPLNCQPDGSIATGAVACLPSYIWQASTDAFGMSKIFAIVQDASKSLVTVCLSLMSNNVVCFKPPVSTPIIPGKNQGSEPVIQTQTWLTTPQSNAKTTADGKNLVSLDLTFQPVFPDAAGNYKASQAIGWLNGNNLVSYDTKISSVFTLLMSGMAPNYMAMKDIKFILNSIPVQSQIFGPTFGAYPSTPVTYSLSGDPLPPFLSFDTTTGQITPNGEQAAQALNNTNSITAINNFGSAQTSFTIVVSSN